MRKYESKYNNVEMLEQYLGEFVFGFVLMDGTGKLLFCEYVLL
jgi:hypothetical protein